MDPATSSLLIDLYQRNMFQAYLARGHVETAVFELFVRKPPKDRSFLLSAGLEQAVEFLENLRFSAENVDCWLALEDLAARCWII